MPSKLLLMQIWGKMVHLPQPQQQGPLLKTSYIPLLSVMTLHYQRLYQISSLEPNSGWQHQGEGLGGHAPLPPNFFFVAKEKKKGKKERVSE